MSSARELRQVLPEEQAATGAPCDSRQCWICLSNGDDLIAPCACTGSMKWVHRRCLDEWRVSATNPRNFTHCRHCGFQFRMVARSPENLTADELHEQLERKQRRRHFTKQACGQCWGGLLLAQVYLFTLAALIRLCDPQEAVVLLLPIEAPVDMKHTFWEALHLYKATYYLAALLLTSLLVGVACLPLLCREAYAQRSTERLIPRPSALMQCRACADVCRTSGRDCRCLVGMGPSLAGCDCGCLVGVGSDCAPALLAIAVLMVFVGTIAVLIGVVTWTQKTFERYLRLRELRDMTGEYIVEDLSKETDLPPREVSLPQVRAMETSGVVVPDFAAGTHEQQQGAVHQRLMRDLQAVYGLDEESLREMLQGEVELSELELSADGAGSGAARQDSAAGTGARVANVV
jgi:hypothetical protein